MLDNEAATANLIAATRRAIARRGLEGLALRDLSQEVGRSTFVVAKRFGNKAGMVAAAVAQALADDTNFHRSFFAGLDGLRPSGEQVVDIVAAYLRQRHAMPETSRVLQVCWLSASAGEGLRDLLVQWHAMRRDHWQRWGARLAWPAALQALWMDWLVMEELYGLALHGRLEYELLLRESLRALLLRVQTLSVQTLGPHALPQDDAVTRWLEKMPRPAWVAMAANTSDVPPLKARLLDAAADLIAEDGPAAITNGRLSKRAGVSTSMISYHFDSVESYAKAALLHALTREVAQQAFFRGWASPFHEAPADAGDVAVQPRPKDLAEWSVVMAPAVQGRRGDGKAGFYVHYARLIGYTCLRAAAQPELADLLMWLRAREGSGTYGSRDHAWPGSLQLGRVAATHFAMWVKGYCLLNEALPGTPSTAAGHRARLCAAAQHFFVLKHPGAGAS